jgi:uncharacterized repeat protein (TIGR01451 family)
MDERTPQLDETKEKKMTHRKLSLRLLTVAGLALGALILTLATLAVAQANGPEVTMVKEPDQTVRSGSSVTFTISITNTGDVTLTNVTVLDSLAPNCGRLSGELPELAPGVGTSYECTLSDVTADLTNSATVTGTPQTGDDVDDVSYTDTAFVDVIMPGIAIAKTASPMTVNVGDTVHYTITVENAGDSDLSNVTVDDDLDGCTLVGPGGDDGDLILEQDETWTYTCSVTAGDENIVNTATASATDEAGGTVDASAQVEVDVIHPGIAIAKTPDSQTVPYNSTATFTISVTNTGDATLTEVSVADPQAPDCARASGTLPDLGPGGNTSYECTVANVTDGFINSATATGRSSAGEYLTDSDVAEILLEETQSCPTDIAAYWKLDETSSGAYDDFYNGHDGECAGQCPTPTAGGRVHGGQAFNGSDTGIDVPAVPGDDSFNWDTDDSFSIEFWMKSSNACSTNNEVIVGRVDDSSELAWWTGCWHGGRGAFFLRDRSGNQASLRGLTDLANGTWHHIVATRNGSVSPSEVRLYVDGKEEDSTTAIFHDDFESLTAGLNIGWLNLYHGYHFEGALDEVAIYDRALSTGEIWQHRNEGLAQRGYCESGPYEPVIVSTAVTEATAGRLYSYDVEAVGDTEPTYTLLVNPVGMTIDPTTGLVSWIPIVAQEGSQDVEVEAHNSEGSDRQSFTVEVSAGTLCPTAMFAYWKLDETDEGTYYDFYDGHDGSCTDHCPSSSDGYIHGGQEFDGGSTRIDVLTDADFEWGPDESFSVEFWMKTSDESTCSENEVVIGQFGGSRWWIGCEDGGVAAFYLRDTNGNTAYVTATQVTGGAWHHVAAVQDADANELRLYVDGTSSPPVETDYGGNLGSSTVALNIGWLDTPNPYYFDGVIDEVAMYHRAVSTEEIQQYYSEREERPAYCINPGIAIRKTANPVTIYSGDTVTYTYTVTNSGDTPLSAISLSDDKCGSVSLPEGDNDSDDQLDLSETWIYRCSMEPCTDITNTAIVTGRHALNDTVSDDARVFVNVISPALTIDKRANSTSIVPGETVTYTYEVTNPGDDPLDVDISDDKCSPLDFTGGDDNDNYVLDPGEAWTYICARALSIDTTNTAIVTGTDSAGGTVNGMATASVDVKT